MKITIDLSPAEVKGIKNYLKEGGEVNPTKSDISLYIDSIVKTTLYSPKEAVSDYIRITEADLKKKNFPIIGHTWDAKTQTIVNSRGEHYKL